MDKLNDLIGYWEDKRIGEQLRKLKFLSYTCESGILGEDGMLHQKDYEDASWGLGIMLEEIVKSLQDFKEKMYALHGVKTDQEKQDEGKAPETEPDQSDSPGA